MIDDVFFVFPGPYTFKPELDEDAFAPVLYRR
jgi:hypothetical protein